MEIENIKFDLTGEVFEIQGRGFAHSAVLLEKTTRTELSKLIGKTLKGQKILGVESFCIENQREGMFVSILVENSGWP